MGLSLSDVVVCHGSDARAAFVSFTSMCLLLCVQHLTETSAYVMEQAYAAILKGGKFSFNQLWTFVSD